MHAHSEHYGRHPLLMYWSLILYMGRLRLVGSLKLNVSFAKYSLFYRALLQTRPVTLRSLLIVATPYTFPVLVSFDSSVSLSTRFLCRSLVVQLGLFEHVSCVSLFSYISSLFCCSHVSFGTFLVYSLPSLYMFNVFLDTSPS